MTSTEGVIGWGIVATGAIAHTVTSDLQLLENCRLAAVCSRELSRAEAFATQFGVDRAYSDIADLIADPAVDIVYVTTPHAQHAPIVRLALEADKAVLCEKPFTTSLPEAEALVTLARKRGVFRMEAMWMKFVPLIVKVRQMVAAGVIGDVRFVTANIGFIAPGDPADRFRNPAKGGGALLDVGVYPVAFAQMLLGEPDAISTIGWLSPEGVDLDAGLLLSWPGGVRAYVDASFVSPSPVTATVVGTVGRIDIQSRFHHPTVIRHVHAPVRDVEDIQVYECPAEGRGYVPMLRAVTQAVCEGRTECPEMTLDETVSVMRTLDEALMQLGVTYPEPEPVL